MHLLGQLQQLEFTALIADGGKSAHQLANAGAVNVCDVAEVEQDLFLAFSDQVTDGVAQNDAAFAQSNASAEVHDRDPINLPSACFHAHVVASEASAEFPRTCLIKVISVPGSRTRNFTSSMNERIKKIPRPDCFNRFSGARGSGISSSCNPRPSSAILITSESPVFSNEMRIFLSRSEER